MERSLRYDMPAARLASPAGNANSVPLALASNCLTVYTLVTMGLTTMPCNVARLELSLRLKKFNGVQPAIAAPALPHLTVPSLSRNDGPMA